MSDTVDEPRPIHFRPTPADAEILAELHRRTGLRSSTELLRWCLRVGYDAAPVVAPPRHLEGGEG